MRGLFEHDDYRAYLVERLASQGKGAKLKLSAVLECQPGYVTQILTGATNLSPEQAERYAAHEGWDRASTRYFLLLVAFARAGSKTLRDHYRAEIDANRGEAMVLKNRFKPEKILSIEDQATFYSSWHFGALHVSVSIPGCDTPEGLARYFALPLRRVNEIVQFLVKVGLVKRDAEGRLLIGSTQVYVGADSPLVAKHHTNWRLRAIESLDRYAENHLHYSSVVSINADDVDRVREILVQTISQIRAIVRDSKDEACFSYALDLFEVGTR